MCAALFVTLSVRSPAPQKGKAAGVHCCPCWCRAAGIAKDTYLEKVPDLYPAAAHKEALRTALRQLWASARGPAAAEAAALVAKVGPPFAGSGCTACPLGPCWEATSAALSEQAAGHIADAHCVLLRQEYTGSLTAVAACVWESVCSLQNGSAAGEGDVTATLP